MKLISLFFLRNNLSNAYIRLGQKARAWKVLQEAAKCDFGNWKVWDNVMVVSTDLAHFDEVIRAYNRILDVKDRHVDAEVLGILVRAVQGNLEDNGGERCIKYRQGATKLIGRLTAQVLRMLQNEIHECSTYCQFCEPPTRSPTTATSGSCTPTSVP